MSPSSRERLCGWDFSKYIFSLCLSFSCLSFCFGSGLDGGFCPCIGLHGLRRGSGLVREGKFGAMRKCRLLGPALSLCLITRPTRPNGRRRKPALNGNPRAIRGRPVSPKELEADVPRPRCVSQAESSLPRDSGAAPPRVCEDRLWWRGREPGRAGAGPPSGRDGVLGNSLIFHTRFISTTSLNRRLSIITMIIMQLLRILLLLLLLLSPSLSLSSLIFS